MNLYPYQQQGVDFLLVNDRAILADDMGLGKTVQLICAINANTSIRSALIVCPASLKANWNYELSRWLQRDIAFVVTNYERLSAGVSNVPGMTFDVAIFDEAHYCKNEDAKRTKNAKQVKAKRIWLATGTPIENRPVEFWSLLTWLQPERFPDTEKAYIEFTKRYCKRRYVIVNKGLYYRSHGRMGCRLDVSGADNMTELAGKTSDFILRRLKKNVLKDLPPKTKKLVILNTVANDGDLLEDCAEGFDDLVRYLSSTRVLFTEWSKRRHEQGLDKVDDVVGYIHDRYESGQVQGKVILFAHHADVIQRYMEEFTALGYNPVRLTGEETLMERGESTKAFQTDSDCKMIVCSIKAAGVGITLTAATWVCFAEIDPTPGAMSQAADRAHRIGQTYNVLVSYFVFDKSIDARICKLLLKKEESIGEFERGIEV
jgi:SWI/SNF-related matrix-associated actin-dependent regulator 1 of chromatin subfamily A